MERRVMYNKCLDLLVSIVSLDDGLSYFWHRQ